MKRKTREKKIGVAHETFVKAWAKAHDIGDVVESTGLSLGGVAARAKRLRDAGVKLPKLERRPRSGTTIDVPALNDLL